MERARGVGVNYQMSNDQSSEEGLQVGDEIEILERHKIIGFSRGDVLTLHLGTGDVQRWDNGLHNRDGMEVVRLD
jgi:hypothetical protein